MNLRERVASFLMRPRNLDSYSSKESIQEFCELREKLINEMGFSLNEMHEAFMKEYSNKDKESQ